MDQDNEHCTRKQTQGRLPMTNSTQGLNPYQLSFAVVHNNSGPVLGCARASDRHDTGYCRKAGKRCKVEQISPRRLKFTLAADNAPAMSPEDGRRGLLICYFHIFECTSQRHSIVGTSQSHSKADMGLVRLNSKGLEGRFIYPSLTRLRSRTHINSIKHPDQPLAMY